MCTKGTPRYPHEPYGAQVFRVLCLETDGVKVHYGTYVNTEVYTWDLTCTVRGTHQGTGVWQFIV
jgi:hypothetical protein